MSYGRPPGVESFSGKPPALGSFPLDHEGNVSQRRHDGAARGIATDRSMPLGECKDFMKEYIKCLKANKNNNGACREFSRSYLQCRMDK
jgi:cytochrome c oxidase assembly protein subunit 19